MSRSEASLQNYAIGATAISQLADILSHRSRLSGHSTQRKEMLATLRELSNLKIDPKIFDSLLSNEMDRRLKRRFGWVFIALTCTFTLLAYTIVVANSVWEWNIPSYAVTALVIETPIQLIGLLYVVARNLFPQYHVKNVGAEESDVDHQDEHLEK